MTDTYFMADPYFELLLGDALTQQIGNLDIQSPKPWVRISAGLLYIVSLAEANFSIPIPNRVGSRVEEIQVQGSLPQYDLKIHLIFGIGSDDCTVTAYAGSGRDESYTEYFVKHMNELRRDIQHGKDSDESIDVIWSNAVSRFVVDLLVEMHNTKMV